MKTDFGSARSAGVAAPALLALVLVATPAVLIAETGALAVPETERAETGSAPSTQNPEKVIQKWPGYSRGLARAMIGAYGPPQRFDENLLAWDDNGMWKRSIVYRKSWPHFIAFQDKDYLEQTIGYRVPDDKVAALKRFNSQISVDKENGELSARSESEKMNYLAINLAEEIITDERTVDEARDAYRKTKELSKAGKSSRYLEGFTFSIDDDKLIVPEYASPDIR